MKKIILSIIILAAIAASCKKDKEEVTVVYPEENFYPAFLVQTGFNQKTTIVTTQNMYENAYTFIPLVKGNINSLIIKLPSANNNLRVSIWDATTRLVLYTQTITTLVTNTENKIPITPFNLQKDKQYLITMASKTVFERARSDYSAVTYPITIGNISITSVLYKNFGNINNAPVIYPDVPTTAAIFGDLSFNFQQTP
jgi:hypothetical protein